MIRLVKLICLLIALFSFDGFAQVGCRKNSTGVLCQSLILLGPDYNNDAAGPNIAGFCLPAGTPGTPCTIRIPFTLTAFAGTYGNYSAINCDLDDHLPIVLVSACLVVVYLRHKRN